MDSLAMISSGGEGANDVRTGPKMNQANVKG
jgi:hypothetical protein